MGRLNEYLEMAKRSLDSISQNLEGDTLEDAIKDFINKARRSRYASDEIINGLAKAFSISKKQAANQIKKYDSPFNESEETKNKEGLTLDEYKKKVRSILDGMTLFGPKVKGFPNESLWKTYGDEVSWDWNDDVPVKESVNKIVKAISAVNARI